MRKALIVQGGWEGHEPEKVAAIFKRVLEKEGFAVEISNTLDAFLDVDKLRSLDLIIPIWTGGSITREQVTPVLEAVAAGVGLAGCHGGMRKAGGSYKRPSKKACLLAAPPIRFSVAGSRPAGN
ncbi:MAG: ThuA domain-containing protein [Firmicutes bacterium]|nr:ThuA domain-containing protein [Bacillota bacterium]